MYTQIKSFYNGFSTNIPMFIEQSSVYELLWIIMLLLVVTRT